MSEQDHLARAERDAAQRSLAEVEAENESLRVNLDAERLAKKFGTPDDPTGARAGSLIDSLRAELEAARKRLAEVEAELAEARGWRNASTFEQARAIVDSYCADGVNASEEERTRLAVFIERALAARDGKGEGA